MGSCGSLWDDASFRAYGRRTVDLRGKQMRFLFRQSLLAMFVNETMDFEGFKAKFYQFWNIEDRPNDVTFDKYQKAYFDEKRFDVEVTDGS
jgi:hypothetical protein